MTPKMASASGALDAYFVGEPFAAQTVRSSDAEVLHYVEEIWSGFLCNLVVVRDDFIAQQPELVATLVQTAVRAGFWARRHPREAARLAAGYWNQPFELVEHALNTPPNRIVFNRYVAVEQELRELAEEMVRFALLESADIGGLVGDRSARAVDLDGIDEFESVAVAAANAR